MFINYFLNLNRQREKLYNKAPKGGLKDFLAVPFPDPKDLLQQTPILSVDFETTGLDVEQDKLLSVGFVSLQKSHIELASSYHQVINTTQKLQPDNVLIHKITDREKEQGLPLQTVVEHLLNALKGKVMLAHFARIERQFLRQACLEIYGIAPVFPIIDTLLVAKRHLDKRDVAYDPSELRLSNLRQRYNLPDHYAHNALNDAIATAELFLAQTSDNNGINKAKLSHYLS